ncbi:MAG: septum formation family protein [Acidimicrobiia bacterium]
MPAPWRGPAALAVAVAALAACGDAGGGGDEAAPPSTVREGPVAATAVAVGDCLNGVVIGAAERREIEAARVVSCDRDHALEVYATFELDPAALDVEALGEYPGPARVVRAADEGCAERIEEAVEDPDAFGLIALWPSAVSWGAGDRSVACAVFDPGGATFDQRQL